MIRTPLVHEAAGVAVIAAVTWRVVWGVLGPTCARFSGFAHRPAIVLAYLRDMWEGRHRRYPGHNPLGALMVFALLAVLAAIALTGMLALGGLLKQGPLRAFLWVRHRPPSAPAAQRALDLAAAHGGRASSRCRVRKLARSGEPGRRHADRRQTDRAGLCGSTFRDRRAWLGGGYHAGRAGGECGSNYNLEYFARARRRLSDARAHPRRCGRTEPTGTPSQPGATRRA